MIRDVIIVFYMVLGFVMAQPNLMRIPFPVSDPVLVISAHIFLDLSVCFGR